MRTSNWRSLMLLALVLSTVLLTIGVRAEVDEDVADVHDAADAAGVEDMMPTGPASLCRAIFPNSSSPLYPTLPAGSKANSVIAYRNNAADSEHVVVLVAAYLQPVNAFNTVIQNFSVVRQGRKVHPGETTTFQYSFTPDVSLEPSLYNLVIGLYFQDSTSNATFFVTAFNNTVTVADAVGTDPRTVLTYITLFIIFGAVAYGLALKFGVVKAVRSALRNRNRPASTARRVEVGTRGVGYDPDYVSKEHQRYREEILRKSSASPSGHRGSPSPNKKRS